MRNPNLEVATNKDWNASVSSQSKLKLVQNLVYQSWNVLKQSVLGRSCLMQRVPDLRVFKALRLYLVLWKIATNLEAQLWLYKYIISFKLSEEELEKLAGSLLWEMAGISLEVENWSLNLLAKPIRSYMIHFTLKGNFWIFIPHKICKYLYNNIYLLYGRDGGGIWTLNWSSKM